MAKNWYPIIDFSLCSECLICVNYCPHGVYDKEKSLPSVINPDNCIDKCRGCQSKCPENAISYFGDNGFTGGSSCGCGCSCC